MILVTAANGKNGADVVAALLCAGQPVRAFVRPKTSLKPELRGAEVFEGDLFERSCIEQSLEGILAGKNVEARQVPLDIAMAALPRDSAEQRYTADTFERMFSYYNRHGLTGNSNILRRLLGRQPTGVHEYFKRALSS